MKIEIDVFSNPKEFIDKWSYFYYYKHENMYSNHIEKGLDDYNSFVELFKWKNGITKISEGKSKLIKGYWSKNNVLKELRKEFIWEKFENEFEPHISGTIWKIFLLHIINPNNFPIFDVNVYRFHYLITERIIGEIPKYPKTKYNYYKKHYYPWFNELKIKHTSIIPKRMDESFFKFGQLLKPMKGLPIKIVDEL